MHIVHSELSTFVSLSCPMGLYDGLTYSNLSTILNRRVDDTSATTTGMVCLASDHDIVMI